MERIELPLPGIVIASATGNNGSTSGAGRPGATVRCVAYSSRTMSTTRRAAKPSVARTHVGSGAVVGERPVWGSLQPMKAKPQAHLLRVSFTILAACSSAAGLAQDLRSYPASTVKFLDVELPLMDAAVAAKDRAYFSGSNARVQAFLDGWGLKSNPVAIEAFPACTDAVTDFQIVGLCRISPPGTICEPATFIPKFEKNLALCRSAASLQ